MKIVTLNLANYDDHPNWDQRVLLIAADLIGLAPDLTAFQEARFNPDNASTKITYQNMAEQVLDAIRHSEGGAAWESSKLLTQPAMYHPPTWEYPQPSTEGATQEWEGLAILSQDRALETGSVFLSKNQRCTGDTNRRITQFAAVEGFDKPLYLFNTHFSFGPGVCRQDEVLETLAYMSRFDGYQLLVGDLNATPDDPALQPLRDAGLVDLWPKLQGAAPGYTAPSDHPTKRIDYCWANQELAARVTTIELIATKPSRDGVYASDHFGLCVTLD